MSRRPGWIVAIWLAVAAAVGCFSPNLTRLAAEGQAKMLPSDAESLRAAELVKQSWPDQAYEAMAVAVLHRPGGLTDADRQYRAAVVAAVRGRRADRRRWSGCSGPASSPEIAAAAGQPATGRSSLVAVSLSSSFVAPVTHDAVAWMERQATAAELAVPGGPRDPLDGRRGDRPRLHGQRPDLARPRRRGDGRPAA